jgi:hypothetical protein
VLLEVSVPVEGGAFLCKVAVHPLLHVSRAALVLLKLLKVPRRRVVVRNNVRVHQLRVQLLRKGILQTNTPSDVKQTFFFFTVFLAESEEKVVVVVDSQRVEGGDEHIDANVPFVALDEMRRVDEALHENVGLAVAENVLLRLFGIRHYHSTMASILSHPHVPICAKRE